MLDVTVVTAQLTVTEAATGGTHAAGIVKHAFSMFSLWKQKSYTFSVSMHTISVGGGHGSTHGPGTIWSAFLTLANYYPSLLSAVWALHPMKPTEAWCKHKAPQDGFNK
jgi:hypothetical protein